MSAVRLLVFNSLMNLDKGDTHGHTLRSSGAFRQGQSNDCGGVILGRCLDEISSTIDAQIFADLKRHDTCGY